MDDIRLGTEVRDKVTGFQGVTISLHSYAFGCERAQVQPRGTKDDGDPKESQGFDLAQLERVGPGIEDDILDYQALQHAHEDLDVADDGPVRKTLRAGRGGPDLPVAGPPEAPTR